MLDAYAAGFDEPEGYLDFGRFGPPGRAVVRTRAELTAAAATGGTSVDELMTHEARARRAAARLLGVPADGVVLAPNTSTGLWHAALGLRGTVLVAPGDFPANTYPWHRAAGVTGLGVRPVAELTPHAVRAALTGEVTALACSAVDSRTGARADLAGLRDVLGDRLLIVDAIQGAGVVDEPWDAADVVVAGGQKWLRAGWATGFLYASPRAVQRLVPTLSGWTGAARPGVFDALDAPAPGAARFSVTNGDPIAAACLADALEFLLRHGVRAVQAAVADTVGMLADAVRGAGAHAHPRRSGILPIALPGAGGPELAAHLAAHGVTVTARPDHVRASVHASTTAGSVERLAGGLRAWRGPAPRRSD